MKGQLFSDEELQSAFRLAYVLHPKKTVAYSVTLDAIERYFEQKKLQEKRPKANARYFERKILQKKSLKVKNQPFKNVLSNAALLQTSVYLASDLWEKDQESKSPSKNPTYKPNVNDLIVRYIKFLVRQTMERNSSYVAVGIGSLLYTYRTAEITKIAPDYFKDDNIRRIKSGIIDKIRERFEQHDIAPKEFSCLNTKQPTDFERKLVQNSLIAFAPWVTKHAGAQLLETYFDYGSQKTEWERNHALIDFGCAGLQRLIQEYNAVFREDNMQLENPDEKLEIPDFGASLSYDDDDRFNPPPLSETELMSLRRAFEQIQRRRELYRPGHLRVSVDGKEQILNWLDSGACEAFNIDSDALYLEVYGNDSSGDLLLSVIPFQRLDFDKNEEIEFSIEKGDATIFNLLIAKSKENEFSVKLQSVSQTSLWERLLALGSINIWGIKLLPVGALGSIIVAIGLLIYWLTLSPKLKIDGPVIVENNGNVALYNTNTTPNKEINSQNSNSQNFNGGNSDIKKNEDLVLPKNKTNKPKTDSLDDSKEELKKEKEQQKQPLQKIQREQKQLFAQEKQNNQELLKFERDITLPNKLNSSTTRNSNSSYRNFYLTPNGTYVKTTKPVLRWGQIAGVDNFRISVFDYQGYKITSADISGNWWKVDKDLAPGGPYRWKVVPLDKNKMELAIVGNYELQGSFMVLNAIQQQRIITGEKTINSPSLSLAKIYLKNALFDDAIRELEDYLTIKPNSKEAKRLLELAKNPQKISSRKN
jgi:hypothetical protein